MSSGPVVGRGFSFQRERPGFRPGLSFSKTTNGGEVCLVMGAWLGWSYMDEQRPGLRLGAFFPEETNGCGAGLAIGDGACVVIYGWMGLSKMGGR